MCSWTPDFQGTLSDRREMNEFLARGVISTHLSLGRKGCIRINEKSYARRAVRYTPALHNMLSLLSEPPPNFKTQRPRSPSAKHPHIINIALASQGHLWGKGKPRIYQQWEYISKLGTPLMELPSALFRGIPKVTCLLNYCGHIRVLH